MTSTPSIRTNPSTARPDLNDVLRALERAAALQGQLIRNQTQRQHKP